MSLLTVVDLGKSYGPEDIFSHLSLSIPHRARMGLVGSNGVGKTTLLRILAGVEEPSSGAVNFARGMRVGYLPQNARLDSTRNLWDECLSAFGDLLSRQAEMARLEAEISHNANSEELLTAYGKIQDEFDKRGGYTYELRIRQTLNGLGFSNADFNRPLPQLSGGQRTRALLAKLLLQSPELLLLDEPTNHLDISAIEWLEAYLREWDGAALIVSHDRYFLNQVVDTILEMTPALEEYRGNYSAYMLQRSERYQRRLAEYQAQQEFIAKEEEYIRRNIAGQNTRQAQGRRKRLERLVEEASLTPPPESRRLHLKLQSSGRSGDLVLRTHDLAVGYADEGKPLFRAPDIVLLRGECAAVLGPNGAGKTTFLKTILGQIPPLEGETVLGASLSVGYFAQAHEGLHPTWTLMDEISAAAPSMLPASIRDYLAKFLFTGDDVFKTVEVLSGGERGRLALAILALQGANLLLLDEPTNHLDLPSQEVLQAILSDFGGTILLVSHDRYLIDSLATQVWEVIPEEEKLSVFNGTYSEYKIMREGNLALHNAPEQKPAAEPTPSTAPAGKNGAPPPRVSKDMLKRKQKSLEELENQVAGLETRQATVMQRLQNPSGDPGEIRRLGQEYNQLEKDLNQALNAWETAQLEMDQLMGGT